MAEYTQVTPSRVTENVRNAVTRANGGAAELTSELEQQIYNGIMAAGGGGGGSGYVLPVATTTTLGGVKPDGTTITARADGTISAVGGGGGGTVTVDAGTAAALPPGSAPTVRNSGTTTAAIFDFGIPAGEKGEKGEPGAVATIAVGTVTALDTDELPFVKNTGSPEAAVFDFGLPRGKTGRFMLGGAQTMKICVPVGSTFPYGEPEDRVEVDALPLKVALKTEYTIPSPFGNTIGHVDVFIKDAAGKWIIFIPQSSGSGSSFLTRGITASCPGDGNIYVTTGTDSFYLWKTNNYGIAAPLGGDNNITSAEIALVVRVASSRTPADYRGEETVAGTWFGKTLYRYCLEVMAPKAISVPLPLSIGKIVSVRGVVRRTDGAIMSVPVYQSSTQYVAVTIRADDSGNHSVNITPYAAFINGHFTLIVEYIREAVDESSLTAALSDAPDQQSASVKTTDTP